MRGRREGRRVIDDQRNASYVQYVDDMHNIEIRHIVLTTHSIPGALLESVFICNEVFADHFSRNF